MNKNLKRISVSVDEDDYQELKDLSRAGLSVGFLIFLEIYWNLRHHSAFMDNLRKSVDRLKNWWF